MNKNSNKDTEQCTLHGVSGSINIQKGNRLNQRQIQSNSSFFTANEDIIVRVDNERIYFSKPTIDYNGKTIKPKAIKSGWVNFHIVADLPITKKLEFDGEESTEDELVVYYR